MENSSSGEISQLTALLEQLFVSQLSFNRDIEILGLDCGSLLVDFRVLNPNEPQNDYSDLFDKLADDGSTVEWKGKNFTYLGVETRVVTNIVEPLEDDHDSKKAIWIPILVIGIVFILTGASSFA